jgi:hypothetical protein
MQKFAELSLSLGVSFFISPIYACHNFNEGYYPAIIRTQTPDFFPSQAHSAQSPHSVSRTYSSEHIVPLQKPVASVTQSSEKIKKKYIMETAAMSLAAISLMILYTR